ncbi:tyrosine-type recombinase/integrase [Oligoflexia bacterium]|nr:tyrosine-type recombinase/integrase [Oligoflexia bacterium]
MATDASAYFADTPTSKEIQSTSFLNVSDSYIRYYASGSSHTARAKRLDLNYFTEFLANFHGFSKPEKLKVKHWDFSSVQRFVEDSLSKGEAPTTVARRLATIKHMGRTLSEKVAGFINPAKDVKPPKVQAPKPKGLTPKEVASVQKKAHNRFSEKTSFIRMRNQTLFEFLIDTGLRADEVRILKMGQLDDDLQWIHNVRTKGKRYRNVYITSDMRPNLQEYLAARQKQLKRFFTKLSNKKDASLPVFISNYNAKPDKPETFLMGPKTIWRAVNELSADTHLHPHLLRHSYAIDLLNSSNDIRLVAQALGHSDVRITMRYTERMDEEVASALEKSRKRKKSA